MKNHHLMVNHAGQLVFLHCHLTGHAVFSVGPAGSIDILKKKTNMHRPSILINIEWSLRNSIYQLPLYITRPLHSLIIVT